MLHHKQGLTGQRMGHIYGADNIYSPTNIDNSRLKLVLTIYIRCERFNVFSFVHILNSHG